MIADRTMRRRITPESAQTDTPEQAERAAIEVKYLPRTRGVKGWLAAIATFPVALTVMVYDLVKLWWQHKRLSVAALALAGALVAGAGSAQAYSWWTIDIDGNCVLSAQLAARVRRPDEAAPYTFMRQMQQAGTFEVIKAYPDPIIGEPDGTVVVFFGNSSIVFFRSYGTCHVIRENLIAHGDVAAKRDLN
jgi:hypothetical protein